MMKKVDPTVIKETLYIAAMCFIMSIIMQSVFLVFGSWNYTVLLGNALGYLASVGNFFLIGLTVQHSLGLEEKAAKNKIRISQNLRFVMLLIVAVIGYLIPVFNTVALIIPYLFPRLSIALRPLFNKR